MDAVSEDTIPDFNEKKNYAYKTDHGRITLVT